MITIYDTDGKVVLRNLASKKFFESTEVDNAKNELFLPYLEDRQLAHTIFSEVCDFL